jgi:flagellar motor switch protein FliN/FliY
MQEPADFAGTSAKLLKLDDFADVSLNITVEFGRAAMTIGELLNLKKGAVVALDHDKTEPLAIRANGKLVARGEIVVVNDNYGIRVTEIVAPKEWNCG